MRVWKGKQNDRLQAVTWKSDECRIDYGHYGDKKECVLTPVTAVIYLNGPQRYWPGTLTDTIPAVIMFPPVDPITSIFELDFSTVGAILDGGCCPDNTTKALTDGANGFLLRLFHVRRRKLP